MQADIKLYGSHESCYSTHTISYLSCLSWSQIQYILFIIIAGILGIYIRIKSVYHMCIMDGRSITSILLLYNPPIAFQWIWLISCTQEEWDTGKGITIKWIIKVISTQVCFGTSTMHVCLCAFRRMWVRREMTQGSF